MSIPVFHDDQHGTAIISGAALINALEISGKRIEDIRIVVSGAGAAAIACSRFYCLMGVKKENIALFDSKGHVHLGRTDLNEFKKEFATSTCFASLADSMKGADAFLGLSAGGILSKDMVASMASHPVIFACANPDPEISYNDAKEARPDAVMGTGRSDYPNQINNVSGFPYIFRGALDVRATEINEAMKLAAAKALAALAKEPVPEDVCKAYGESGFSFGIDYIIPKPLDKRLIEYIAPAVAQAAQETGVAKSPITDLEAYRQSLRERLDASNSRIEGFLQTYGE